MSNLHYILDLSGDNDIRGNIKLLNASSAKYGGDWHSVPHTHNYAELFYIVGGDGQFQIEDELHPISAHQLVIVNPNVLHTEVSYDAHPLEYIVLGIEGLALSVGDTNDGRFCILNYSDGETILFCLRSILQEIEFRAPGYNTICQAYMEILIVQLMRSTRLAMTPPSSASVINRQCASIRHYIDNHYKEHLTLDLLAEKAKANKFYIAHAFKQEYGISPINYMISCRIEESKRLLNETDLSLSQIAGILGFSSASYFSQSFRRHVGISPVEYRKKKCQKATPAPN